MPKRLKYQNTSTGYLIPSAVADRILLFFSCVCVYMCGKSFQGAEVCLPVSYDRPFFLCHKIKTGPRRGHRENQNGKYSYNKSQEAFEGRLKCGRNV